MPIIKSKFAPPRHWRNAHLQTLWPSQMRRAPLLERHSICLTLNDGDEILLDATTVDNKRKPAVLLIHGLSGCSESGYILGLQHRLKQQRIFSAAMNMRGASKSNNRARGYHAGSSDDLAEVIAHLVQHYPEHEWHAIGFSLGGNILLKHLGECTQTLLSSAAAVSVPFDLDACSRRIDQGFSKIYQSHILKHLRDYMLRRHEHLKQHHPEEAKTMGRFPINRQFSSLWEMDNEVTAPIHGFLSAQDYYDRCSSRPLLKKIAIPTHIIQAWDDPFMSTDIIPLENELSAQVSLELSDFGGHVGFYNGGGQYYIESVIDRILKLG